MADLHQAAGPLRQEYDQLAAQMADPALHASAGRAKKLGRRFAQVSQLLGAFDHFDAAVADLEAAQELAGDPAFAAEIPALTQARDEAESELRAYLAPRDPDDASDVILEIKAGAGGEESALFADDLLRMYQRFAEAKGWSVEVISATPTPLGGIKEVALAIRAPGNPEPQDGVWAHLKYEGGVHRVQRVPVTESQGRVHTSAAGVLVMPEADDPTELEIDAHDLKIDVYRSSGPGGQSVNTTDSAVRITHLPTGLVVSCQNEKSQLQNREQALRVLRSRLLQMAAEAAAAAAAESRRSQV
ncbi:MAG: PCRF domain-containing protein, partial [Micrococcales bacterium]|nr:PCRF domain-containing protein [Micrococcales bacterium]